MNPHPRLSLSLLLSTGLSCAAAGAVVPTEWSHRQSLDVPAPGLVRVELPPQTFDSAGPSQEDLRVLDASGAELAAWIERPRPPAASLAAPAGFALRLLPSSSQIDIRTGTDARLASITLDTPTPFFLCAARVEVSQDQVAWKTLDEGAPLFRQWGVEKLELPLNAEPAAFIRITVGDFKGSPLAFTGARLSLRAAAAAETVPVAVRIVRREEFAGETVLTLSLDGRRIPLATLSLQTREPLFMRQVRIGIRQAQPGGPAERILASGAVYRLAVAGATPREQLQVPLECSPESRELLLHIVNGDSPPLAIEGVEARRQPVSLVFMAPAAGRYQLLSGNPRATTPRYDIASFAGDMGGTAAQRVRPGEIEDTPGYHPGESLATAPAPDFPLEGAPIDAAAWTLRRTLNLSAGGVQELELDTAVLAASRPDLGDLRLLRDGNQIPYVLEMPQLARQVDLAPVGDPDPKRPSLSRWKLHLGDAGLPVRSLVLASSTPLFERQIRVYETIPDDNGAAREHLLAWGAWSRTPEPGTPPNRILEFQDRVRTDTLWIETDNGDNPAIALDAVKATYPVARLIFKVATTQGYSLAYGNPDAGAPRYDLGLVAARLLTTHRNIASLGPAEKSARSANPLAGLSGGYAFWGALVVMVAALLLVVAKLLPKPPA